MKTLKKISFLLLLLAVITSCTKEEKFATQSLDDQKANLKNSSLVPVVDLMENDDDPEDEAVNMQLYEWGLEVRDRMSNSQFYSSMLNALMNDNDHVMTFTELDIIPATATVEYDNVTYYPHVWLYNADTVDGELDPYLCLGTDIDVEEALAVYQDDEYIAGWKLFDMEDIVLCLNDVESMQNPVFIIGFAEAEDEYFGIGEPRRSATAHPNEQNPGYKRFWAKAFRIDHRYDHSSKSEVRMDYHFEIDGKFENLTVKVPVQEIHKDDLNGWEYFSHPLIYFEDPNGAYGDDIPFNSEVNLLGIVYEHDWWCLSKKTVTINGQYKLYYRTKYASHFYQIFVFTDISVGNGEFFTSSSLKIYQDE